MNDKRKRPVEMVVCYHDHTWDTRIVYVDRKHTVEQTIREHAWEQMARELECDEDVAFWTFYRMK